MFLRRDVVVDDDVDIVCVYEAIPLFLPASGGGVGRFSSSCVKFAGSSFCSAVSSAVEIG